MIRPNPYFNPQPYIPASLSEINDLIGSMILDAPTFVDRLGEFPDRNIESEFRTLTGGFGVVRNKLGEERYATLMDLAVRARRCSQPTRTTPTAKRMRAVRCFSRWRTC